MASQLNSSISFYSPTPSLPLTALGASSSSSSSARTPSGTPSSTSRPSLDLVPAGLVDAAYISQKIARVANTATQAVCDLDNYLKSVQMSDEERSAVFRSIDEKVTKSLAAVELECAQPLRMWMIIKGQGSSLDSATPRGTQAELFDSECFHQNINCNLSKTPYQFVYSPPLLTSVPQPNEAPHLRPSISRDLSHLKPSPRTNKLSYSSTSSSNSASSSPQSKTSSSSKSIQEEDEVEEWVSDDEELNDFLAGGPIAFSSNNMNAEVDDESFDNSEDSELKSKAKSKQDFRRKGRGLLERSGEKPQTHSDQLPRKARLIDEAAPSPTQSKSRDRRYKENPEGRMLKKSALGKDRKSEPEPLTPTSSGKDALGRGALLLNRESKEGRILGLTGLESRSRPSSISLSTEASLPTPDSEKKRSLKVVTPTLSSTTDVGGLWPNLLQKGDYPSINVDLIGLNSDNVILDTKEDLYLVYFLLEEHVNFIYKENENDHAVISILKYPHDDNGNHSALKTTKRGYEVLNFQFPELDMVTIHQMRAALTERYPEVPEFWIPAKASDFARSFAKLEQTHQQKRTAIKIGLIYATEGQTHPQDMFKNGLGDSKCSPEFTKFLNHMGTEIDLSRTGTASHCSICDPLNGSDTVVTWGRKGRLTMSLGETSIVRFMADWHSSHLVIYHVAPNMGAEGHRRLIGNDVAVIIFLDKCDTPFDLGHITELGTVPQVFVVVQPVDDDHYRIACFTNKTIKHVTPRFPHKPLAAADMKDYLLAKIYNATLERIISEFPPAPKSDTRSKRSKNSKKEPKDIFIDGDEIYPNFKGEAFISMSGTEKGKGIKAYLGIKQDHIVLHEYKSQVKICRWEFLTLAKFGVISKTSMVFDFRPAASNVSRLFVLFKVSGGDVQKLYQLVRSCTGNSGNIM